MEALLNDVIIYFRFRSLKAPDSFHRFKHVVAAIIWLTDENDSVISCWETTALMRGLKDAASTNVGTATNAHVGWKPELNAETEASGGGGPDGLEDTSPSNWEGRSSP